MAADRCVCAEEPMLPLPIQFLVAAVAAAINDRMARQLEYAQEEVRTLKEALTTASGTERIKFTEAQRRRLALKGKALTPRERTECCQILSSCSLGDLDSCCWRLRRCYWAFPGCRDSPRDQRGAGSCDPLASWRCGDCGGPPAPRWRSRSSLTQAR